jgi:hypothetical protein
MILNKQLAISVRHVVYKYGGYYGGYNGGFFFDQSPSSFFAKTPFSGCAPIGAEDILIPIDPLTAIGLGLVTPEELNYPPGILAAFNLLRGHSK